MRIIIFSFLLLTCSCVFTGCRNDMEQSIQTENVQKVVKETEPELKQEVQKEQQQEPQQELLQQVEESFQTQTASCDLPALHLEGAQLTDSNGKAIQLRGVSTHGIAWFPQYVNREFFTELHEEWNANVVRLAMYTAEYGGYCSGGNQEELKQLVKDGVEYATNADMYVIVDWHILQDGNPNQNKEVAKKFFEEMSGEFGDADNVLYEICNEPNGGTTWAEIKSYAEEIIPIIRANDEDAIIIVGTPTWSQEVDKAAVDPIEGYDNIMYTLHFYAADHTDWLRDSMSKAVDAGLPIFVTEFGICAASGDGGIDVEQSNQWIQTMDECGVSYVAWNLSNKAETSAIFLPSCGKTSGFGMEDLSENGKWIYEMLTGEHAESMSAQDSKQSDEVDDTNQIGESTQNNNSSIEGTNENLTYTAAIVNSWEADAQTFSQYVLTIENISGQDIDGWLIELPFEQTILFSDGWNANYTVDNTTLVITPMEYNSGISNGGTITDIGFIISSPTN